MISSARILRVTLSAYVCVFLAYLLSPLLYMLAAAFNSSRFPTLLPWQGTTLNWFVAAWQDELLWRAAGTGFLVGICVVMLSIVLGLGGALLMTRVEMRGKNLIYAILVSPILMPGIVIGLSTAIFWSRAANTSGFWGLSVL